MPEASWIPWAIAAGAGVGIAVLLSRRGEAAALPEPSDEPETTRPETTVRPVPPAPSGFETGTQFLARMVGVSESSRERAARDAILRGNSPASSRTFKAVTSSAIGHTATFFVTPDYQSVGVDGDAVRIPLTPGSAQELADAAGAVLPTRRMVDLIYQQADYKLPFHAQSPRAGETRNSTRLVAEHDRLIDADLAGRVGLVAGHKKDVVVGNLQARSPGRVAIYGGWYGNGNKVQPLSTVHGVSYMDYSHAPRLIRSSMILDGRTVSVTDVLRDPVLHVLLSDEGVVSRARY